jgi:hypothetical protein
MLNGSGEHLSAQELASRLKGKREGKHYRACCPAHDDADPSLTITEGEDGKILVHCKAGCTQEAVIGALRAKGLWPQRVSNGARQRAAKKQLGRIVAIYDYVDEIGNLLFQTVRFEPKTFRQRRPNGKGGYTWSLEGVQPILYRLPDLIEAVAKDQTVFVVEGEKDVENLAKIGIVATCNHGGAGKWRAAVHSQHLKDASVVVIPDNDQAGRDHANSVVKALDRWATSVRVLELPGLPEKGDVSDWLANGGTAEQLQALAEKAPLATKASAAKPATPTQAAQTAKQTQRRAHWIVEPWPEEVDGATLLNDLVAALKKYMVLPPHTAEVMALWLLHAWTINAVDISPFLVVVSPTKQCGKTTLLVLLFWLTPKSVLASNISGPATYRFIEDEEPTLFIDEADSFVKENEGMRGILNSGHTRPAAFVLRCEGEGSNQRPREFSTWCAKVIASIGVLAATLMDRSIQIWLRRRKKDDPPIERRPLRDTPELAELRRRCRRWANDHMKALEGARPDMPPALFNRVSDNWEPLLAIADLAGGEWPERARKAPWGCQGRSMTRSAASSSYGTSVVSLGGWGHRRLVQERWLVSLPTWRKDPGKSSGTASPSASNASPVAARGSQRLNLLAQS